MTNEAIIEDENAYSRENLSDVSTVERTVMQKNNAGNYTAEDISTNCQHYWNENQGNAFIGFVGNEEQFII